MLKTRNLIAMGAVAAATVVVPIAGMAASGPAGAAKTKTITCTKMSGNASTTVKVSGCNGNTGTKSKKLNPAILGAGGVVKWANGKTTTIGAPTLGAGTNCPVGTNDATATGAVTADTTLSAKPIPGVYNIEVCVDGSGNVSLPAGHPLTIN
jgi:hypothetical protein